MYTPDYIPFEVQIIEEETDEISRSQLVYYKNTKSLVFEIDNNQKIKLLNSGHSHRLDSLVPLTLDSLTLHTHNFLMYNEVTKTFNNALRIKSAYINDTITENLIEYCYSSSKILSNSDKYLLLDATNLVIEDKLKFRENLSLGNSATKMIGTITSQIAKGFHTHELISIKGRGNSITRNIGVNYDEVATGDHSHNISNLNDVLFNNSLLNGDVISYNNNKFINYKILNDAIISTLSLWSSNNITEKLNVLLDVNSNYNVLDKEAIRNNIGLNNSAVRNIGINISNIAEGYHIHDLTHIIDKGNSISKNVGTTTLDVAVGYHIHSALDLTDIGDSALGDVGIDVAAGNHIHTLASLEKVYIDNLQENNILIYDGMGDLFINSTIVNDELISDETSYSINTIKDKFSLKLGLDSSLTSNQQFLYRNKFGITEVATFNLGLNSDIVLAPGQHTHDFNSYVGVDTETLDSKFLMMYTGTSWTNGSYVDDNNTNNYSSWSSHKIKFEGDRALSVTSTTLSLEEKSTIRDNLGLRGASLLNTGTLSNNVSSGNHKHSLNSLNNVSISNLINNNVLIFDSNTLINSTAFEHFSLKTSNELFNTFKEYVTVSNTVGLFDQSLIRANLSLGDSAVKNIGTLSTEVASGDHSHRISDIAGFAIQSPLLNNVLSYNGNKWINISIIPISQLNDVVVSNNFMWSSSKLDLELSKLFVIANTISYSDSTQIRIRGNLGLGDSSTKNIGTLSTEVASGDHSHNLEELDNVLVDNLTNNDILVYNNSKWTNTNIFNTINSSDYLNTEFNKYLLNSELNSMINTTIAQLDNNAKIGITQLPSMSINNVYTLSQFNTSNIKSALVDKDIHIGDFFVDTYNNNYITYVANSNIYFNDINIVSNDPKFNEIEIQGRVRDISINGNTTIIGAITLNNSDSRLKLNLNEVINQKQLVASDNLSDLPNKLVARSNLQLSELLTKDFGTTATSVSAGIHEHNLNESFYNISIDTPSNNQCLLYTGSRWINSYITIPDSITSIKSLTKSYSSLGIFSLLDYKVDKTTSNIVPLINGKVSENVLPELAVSSVILANTNDLNLLDVTITSSVYHGNIVILSSNGYNVPYIYNEVDPLNPTDYDISKWHKISATSKLKTVNSKTGTINLIKSDFIDLSKVINSIQLVASNNLSDLTDISEARLNLELNDEIVTTTFGSNPNQAVTGLHNHFINNMGINTSSVSNGQVLGLNSSNVICPITIPDENNIYDSIKDYLISPDFIWSTYKIQNSIDLKANNLIVKTSIAPLDYSYKGLKVINPVYLPEFSVNSVTDFGTDIESFNNATSELGDFAILTVDDVKKAFVCTINSSNDKVWTELNLAQLVMSVNNKADNLILNKTDIGLSNVSNNLQLIPSNNLNELSNKATSRENIGLTAVTTSTFGTSAGQVAEGNHTHDVLLKDNSATTSLEYFYSVNKIESIFINKGLLGTSIAKLDNSGKLSLVNKVDNVITRDFSQPNITKGFMMWDGTNIKSYDQLSPDLNLEFGGELL